MKFVPYITLNGNAAEAVEYYTKVLEATNRGVMRYGDQPDQSHPLPEAAKNLVLHAEIEVDGNRIYFSDTFPGNEYVPGDLVAIAALFTDEAKIKKVYHGLAEGGNVMMELQKTFWSPAFGMVRDRYGVIWQLSFEAGQ